MDKETGKIAAMSLIQVSEVDKSNEMEKKGFIKALQIIKDKNITPFHQSCTVSHPKQLFFKVLLFHKFWYFMILSGL